MTTTDPGSRLFLFAGPNGCGKTTFARAYFKDDSSPPPFLNADEIARGLSPLKPEDANLRAARILLAEIHSLIAQRQPFALESTLGGLTYRRLLQSARRAGYLVELHYLRLPDVEIAVRRVRQRHEKGGHFVPPADIRRRYLRSLSLLEKSYLPLAHEWTLWDNSCLPPARLADWLSPPASLTDLLRP